MGTGSGPGREWSLAEFGLDARGAGSRRRLQGSERPSEHGAREEAPGWDDVGGDSAGVTAPVAGA